MDFIKITPPTLTGKQWLVIAASVVLGFIGLITPMPGNGMLNVLLFTGIPLATLFLVMPNQLNKLFKPVSGKDILLVFGFLLLNLVVSVIVGLLVIKLYGNSPNPTVAGAADMDTLERILLFTAVPVQLLGEELFTIIPLLAVMWFGQNKLNMSRTAALVFGIAVSTILFGAMHLETYHWNIFQALVAIGAVRLVLTASYLIAGNLWVSTILHVINDWLLIGFAIMGAG